MFDPADPNLVPAAIARLVGDDPLAPVIVAAVALDHPESFPAVAALALVTIAFEEALVIAGQLASNRRERQHLAVVACFVRGDVERGKVLSREHLAEFPDDIVVSWLTSRH